MDYFLCILLVEVRLYDYKTGRGEEGKAVLSFKF
jgi:hypothetical protein